MLLATIGAMFVLKQRLQVTDEVVGTLSLTVAVWLGLGLLNSRCSPKTDMHSEQCVSGGYVYVQVRYATVECTQCQVALSD